jgi:lipid IVA palmitoyltransferase
MKPRTQYLNMTKALSFCLFFFCTLANALSIDDIQETVTGHFSDIKNNGKNEVHIPTYTYHFPFGYDRDIYDQLNQWPLGIGFGKGLTRENGRWSGYYFLTFSDSHHDQEPSIIYGQTWPIIGGKNQKISLGYVAFLTARSDTLNYFPFPGVLPTFSVTPSESIKVTAAYVPGFKHGTGNVLFFTTSISY